MTTKLSLAVYICMQKATYLLRIRLTNREIVVMRVSQPNANTMNIYYDANFRGVKTYHDLKLWL